MPEESMYHTQSPFDVPGQECTNTAMGNRTNSRSGPCSKWGGLFKQCEIAYMTGTVAFDLVVAVAGGPITVAVQKKQLYGVGVDASVGTNVTTGLEIFGPPTLAQTTVGSTAALSPGENIVFRTQGLAFGVLPLVRDGGGGIQSFGTPWINAGYPDIITQTLLTQIAATMKHGSMNNDQWLGAISYMRPASYRDNLPQPGSFMPLRCADLSGAQQDPDRLLVELAIDKAFQIENNPVAPTQVGTWKFVVGAMAYGVMECRGKSGICVESVADAT